MRTGPSSGPGNEPAVWRDNVAELAAELDARPGRYELDTSESGRAMRDFSARLRVSPSLQPYERVF